MAEGPLERKKRGSWLVGARKSYLQYILERTFPDTSLIFALEDVQGRLTYDLTPKNNVTLYVLESYSEPRPFQHPPEAGHQLADGSGLPLHAWPTSAGATRPSSKLLIVNHAAWMREKFDNHNPDNLPLGAGYYGEWVWKPRATWMWNPQARWMSAGRAAPARQRVPRPISNRYRALPRLLDHFDGTATAHGRLRAAILDRWARAPALHRRRALGPSLLMARRRGLAAGFGVAGARRVHAHPTRLRAIRAVSRDFRI